MTKPDANVNPSPASGEGTTQAGPAPSTALAQKVAAALAGKQDGPSSAPGTVETPDEIVVNWDGTPRKMKVADMLSAVRKAEEVSQMDAVVQRRLKMLGKAEELQALHDQIESMSPAQRQRYVELLRNPAALEQPDDERDVLDEQLGAAPKQQAREQRGDPRYDQLAEVVRGLAGLAQQQLAERKQRTLEQQLEDQWSQWDVLKRAEQQNPGSVSFLRRSVMAQHASDPSVGLDKLVAEAAKTAQSFVDATATGVLSEITGSPALDVPERKFKGADLMGGQIREAILKALPRR